MDNSTKYFRALYKDSRTGDIHGEIYIDTGMTAALEYAKQHTFAGYTLLTVNEYDTFEDALLQPTDSQ